MAIKLWCHKCNRLTNRYSGVDVSEHNMCTICDTHLRRCNGCILEANQEKELHYEQDAEIATKFECTKCHKEQYVTPEIKLLAAIFGEYVCIECTHKEEVREQIMVNGKPLSEYLKEV